MHYSFNFDLVLLLVIYFFFFFNVTATTEIYTFCHPLPLHDALPIWPGVGSRNRDLLSKGIGLNEDHVDQPGFHLGDHRSERAELAARKDLNVERAVAELLGLLLEVIDRPADDALSGLRISDDDLGIGIGPTACQPGPQSGGNARKDQGDGVRVTGHDVLLPLFVGSNSLFQKTSGKR